MIPASAIIDPAILQRQALACALLANPGLKPADTRSLLSETAAWVATGQWPAAGRPASAARTEAGSIRAITRAQPILQGSLADKALTYFQGLVDARRHLPGNPEAARALGLRNPDSAAAGRTVSKLLGRVVAHQGWTIERAGCAANGNLSRRIVAGPRTFAQVAERALEVATAPSSMLDALNAIFDGGAPNPTAAAAMAPAASPSAAPAAPETIPAPDDNGPVGSSDGPMDAARNPEAHYVLTHSAEPVPPTAGVAMDVTPAQGGGWPGGVSPDGARRIDHCAALAVEIVERGEVLPSLADLLARLKARFNGAWHLGGPATISGAFAQLKELGFCRIESPAGYPRRQHAPLVRQLILWDGRRSALPPMPAPVEPPKRVTVEEMRTQRAAAAAIIDPAGPRRQDRLAALLLACVEHGEPVPSNRRIAEALGLGGHPAAVPDLIAALEMAGWGWMERQGEGKRLQRRYILADGRATPWCDPIGGGAPAAPAEPASAIPARRTPTPNPKTGLIERRPSIGARARTLADRDVSPDLRAQIEARVAAGAVTRVERPGYAVASDAHQVHSTAGARRSAGY